jgi:hypothetical protein
MGRPWSYENFRELILIALVVCTPGMTILSVILVRCARGKVLRVGELH